MKYEVEIDGSRRTVEIKSFKDRELIAIVDGRELECEVVQPEPGTYLFITKGTNNNARIVYETKIDASNDGTTIIDLLGSRIETRVIDPKHRSRVAAHGMTGRQQILSPMPGKVVRIIVEIGEEVKLGQGVVVIEAMKMQNELKSPKDGSVIEIAVTEGQTVTASQTLLLIE